VEDKNCNEREKIVYLIKCNIITALESQLLQAIP